MWTWSEMVICCCSLLPPSSIWYHDLGCFKCISIWPHYSLRGLAPCEERDSYLSPLGHLARLQFLGVCMAECICVWVYSICACWSWRVSTTLIINTKTKKHTHSLFIQGSSDVELQEIKSAVYSTRAFIQFSLFCLCLYCTCKHIYMYLLSI